MNGMATPALLPGVDLAAFAAALAARLRDAGIPVSASGQASLVQALQQLVPRTPAALYWGARLTLVSRVDELATFDAVFASLFGVFGSAEPDGANRPPPPIAGPRTPVAGVGHRAKRRSCAAQAQNLPWDTRSLTMASAGQGGPSRTLPDVLPSRIVARADEPFDQFDPDDLRLLGAWLEATMARWPRRRSMRFESSPHGKRIDLRATMKRRAGGHPEVFAFSTSLTRLTSVLSHRSAEMALHRANARVTDRYGGTFIGRSVAALLAPPHGNALRGAVVIIASDGWDSDPPDVLVHALTRVRRRAELLVWLNPRAAHPEFQPRAGSMAAALPYCDLFLPAHSLAGLHQLLLALAGAR